MYCKVCVSLLESKAMVQLIDQGFQSMGYTLIDNQDADPGGTDEYANGYRVYKLTPVNVDQPATFIRILYGSSAADPNYVYFEYYLKWDPATHTGSYGCTDAMRLYTSAASGYFGYAYIYEDKFFFATYVGGTWSFIKAGYVDTVLKPHTRISSPATAGTNVWVQVDDLTGFKRGLELWIFGNEDNIIAPPKIKVLEIDEANSQVLIENLPIDVDNNYHIGFWCHGFIFRNNARGEWYSLYNVDCDIINPGFSWNYGNVDYKIVAGLGSYDKLYDTYVLSQGYFVNDNASWANMFPGYWSKEILSCSGFTVEDALYVEKLDEGTASSATSTTLVDSTKNWATDEFVGKIVVITSGTGYGQSRVIQSNDASTLTLFTPWEITPDSTSVYLIVSDLYRYYDTNWFREYINQ